MERPLSAECFRSPPTCCVPIILTYLFFFNDTATTEISTLSLHDALPISASTTRRTASAPARWPAVRGRPRRAAQRPLPSITIATWREGLCDIKLRLKKNSASAMPGGADQRLHVVQVALQRAATRSQIGRAHV